MNRLTKATELQPPVLYLPALARAYWSMWDRGENVSSLIAWCMHPDIDDMIVVYTHIDEKHLSPVIVAPVYNVLFLSKVKNNVRLADIWSTASEPCDSDLMLRLAELTPYLEVL